MDNSLYTGDLPSMLLRLFAALVLSSVFGWERERKNRAAGLRTHMLVCVGSTLITLVSESYVGIGGALNRSDPARLSAQIVSGIGFLGAGTIMVRGGTIRGLTTAATLWISAAIGIAVGRGGQFFIVATVTSVIVLFILTIVDHLEDVLIRKQPWREVTVCFAVGAGSDVEIASKLAEVNVQIRSIERQESPDPKLHLTTFFVQLPPRGKPTEIDAHLLEYPWVQRIEWER